MAPRIYLDLDGVMADFDAHFPATFDCDHRSMADDDMWATINAHPSYFRDMPPCPGAIEFWSTIRHLDPIILTACPRSNYQHVARQKRAWVRQHLTGDAVVLPVMGGRNKPLFMHAPGDILIDDFERNTKAWEDEGGIAILHRDFAATERALFACCPPAAEPRQVQVKALVWEALPSKGRYIAVAPLVGRYIADSHPGSGTPGWKAPGTDEEWQLTATLDEAKAAAQADCERRILSALTASPVHEPGEEEAERGPVPTGECEFRIGQAVHLATPYAEDDPSRVYFVTGIDWEHRPVSHKGWSITVATAEEIAKGYGATDGFAPSDLRAAITALREGEKS